MSRQSKSPIGFHDGDTLRGVAQTYSTLAEAIFEQVQNALDAGAKSIWAVVNLLRGFVHVRDNGEGVALADFEKRLDSMCEEGRKGRDKLGRFSRGLVSPLGKCETFYFVSCPKSSSTGFLEWTFRTKELFGQRKFEGVPYRPREDFVFQGPGSRGQTAVQWRTETRMENISEDRKIAEMTPGSLAEGILARYNDVMLPRNVKVNLKFTGHDGSESVFTVTAKPFRGQPLEVVRLGGETGAVFELYLRRRGDRGSRINLKFGETGNDFAIAFSDFSRSVQGILPDEVIGCLGSGVFEGRISSGSAKLHPSRKKFVANDGLLDFCAFIEEWHREIGIAHLKKAQEQKRETYCQAVGTQVLKVLADALKGEQAFKQLAKAVEGFRVGSVGLGHMKPARVDVVGTTEGCVVAVGGQPYEKREGGSEEPRERNSQPKSDHPSHRPFTVSGPRGRKRVLVKGDSVGLNIEYDFEGARMGYTDRLWELDGETGTLVFNCQNRAWASCEANAKALARLQLEACVAALFSQTLPEGRRDEAAQLFNECAWPSAFIFGQGDKLLASFLAKVKSPRPPKAVEMKVVKD